MKVLKIINSEDLPLGPNRYDNYIYFCYDNLVMYNGKIQYTDPYCIVEEFPTVENNPVPNIFYIRISDGVLCLYLKDVHEWFEYANIESADQLEYLEKVGTTFFMKSGYRYIDPQTKALNLPFEDGSYQLSVAVNSPIEINESTVIIFNPETGQFEIDGGRYYDEYGRNPDIMQYEGSETNTAITTITNDHIGAEVKISSATGNMIQSTATGLYVPANSYASLTEFQELVTRCQNQADTYAASLAAIQDSLAQLDITLDDETLKEKIDAVVRKYFPNIAAIIRSYNELYTAMGGIVGELTEEIDDKIANATVDIVEELERLRNTGGWEFFTSTFEVELTNTSGTNYTILASVPIISGYATAYIASFEEYYPGQVIDVASDLGYIVFNNGDEVDLGAATNISVIFGALNDNLLTVESCGYATVD